MPRLTLFKKILIITLLLSLVPLVTSSLMLLLNLESISSYLSSEIAETSDTQASESLQMRARHVAETVADLLRQCENDLLFLARSRPDRLTLFDFYLTRRGEIWERDRESNLFSDNRDLIPRYQSIALIDRHGQERIVIRDGRTVPENELRNVADPASTEFKSEDYFRKTRSLEPGRIHVTHLTGFHVSRQQQLQGAGEPEDANGEQYRGVVRFCTPLKDKNDRFDGILVISLDHRHLMEITQHIDPGPGYSTIFPSYKSGNYAFLFDDEGWVITHPRFWYIRGVDKEGRAVPPVTERSAKADLDAGLSPFKLDTVPAIDPNYPKIVAAVRMQQSGYREVLRSKDAKNIVAYAPILYNTGDYRTYGVFGGVTIAFKVDQFNDLIRKGSRLISSQLKAHRTRSSIILLLTACLSALAAWWLSRGIGKPLQELTDGVRKLAAGDTGSRVVATSFDEVGELARTFNVMADELESRKNSLLKTLDELRTSRREILAERDFKESILESITSAIVTISPDGALTSINDTGVRFLGNREQVLGSAYRHVFAEWGDVPERIEHALSQGGGYGRQPLKLDRAGDVSYYDVGVFPTGRSGEHGVTITMRNETEREKLREEMMRLDRLASLGKLSAGIAHEIRNPLTGISLLLDDLHDNAARGTEDREMIRKAVEEIDRVERLINALLNYSSPARVEFRESDLNQVVTDTVLLMRRPAFKSGVSIELTCGAISSFRFDPEKIKQALLNIIRNALEAMQSGGSITIVTLVSQENAVIKISDTGPGISEHELPLIFEPFFTRKGAGTGLGLSITQRIIEEHHGRIHVESIQGKGTDFTIELPHNR